ILIETVCIKIFEKKVRCFNKTMLLHWCKNRKFQKLLPTFSSLYGQNKLTKSPSILSLSPLRKQTIIESASTSPIDENPPALPPKRQRVNSSKTASIISTPPSSPKLAQTENTPS